MILDLPAATNLFSGERLKHGRRGKQERAPPKAKAIGDMASKREGEAQEIEKKKRMKRRRDREMVMTWQLLSHVNGLDPVRSSQPFMLL